MDEKKVSPSPSPPVHHEETIQAQHAHHTRQYRDTNVEGQPAYEEHGALIDHKVPQEDVVRSHPDLAWSRIRHYLRDPFSEFFGKISSPVWLVTCILTGIQGTFILILFGDGVVAQVVLSDGERGE